MASGRVVLSSALLLFFCQLIGRTGFESDRGAPPHPGVLGERDSGDRERLTARKSCVILELHLDLETTCFSGDGAICIPLPAIVPKDPANEASDYKHGVITIPRDPANCVVPRAKGTDEINNNGRPLCVKHLKPLECTRIKRKRWFTRRVQYYPNSDASFNFMALTIQLSGDIHPLPGPNTNTSTMSRIPARITSNRRNTKTPTPRHRVESNCIKIDTIDTQAMFFGTQQILSKIPNVTVPFLGKKLTPISSCKDLGVTLDCSLSFNAHINHLSSSLLATLSQISRVRHLFSQDVLLQILNSLVFSKLFYCSTVWSGTTKQNIYKLQLLQNFAARIVTGTNKFNHISPALKELGWLPVADLLHLRDVAMVYKCLNGLTPTYLSSKLVKRSSIHSHHTRQEDHIHIPYCRTTTAQQSFFYHALCSWNQLSTDTKSSKDTHSFKRNAKKEIAK